MAQLFRPGANSIARLVLAAILLLPLSGLVLAGVVARSPYVTGQDRYVEQPVPFSHQHHAGELGIDCRYCHTGVETAAFAGVPPTRTCMTCHSQLYTNAAMLAPVRESLAAGRPLRWNRVNKLPGYVYFDHHVHVNNGVPCVACHGNVRDMPLMRQQEPLTMGWCLDCHRNPAGRIVPKSRVYDAHPMAGLTAGDRDQLRRQVAAMHFGRLGLTDCSVCHR